MTNRQTNYNTIQIGSGVDMEAKGCGVGQFVRWSTRSSDSIDPEDFLIEWYKLKSTLMILLDFNVVFWSDCTNDKLKEYNNKQVGDQTFYVEQNPAKLINGNLLFKQTTRLKALICKLVSLYSTLLVEFNRTNTKQLQ